MTNREWIILLSNEFDISHSKAKQMYHEMLDKKVYWSWLEAFNCRMANIFFDYDSPKGKCIECKQKKYCYKNCDDI